MSYSTTLFCQTNDTVRVVEVLLSIQRSAFVLPPKQGYVLIYDQAGDDGDEAVVRHLSSHLSREMEATTIAVLNGDDDLLVYYLYVNGALRDQYRSSSNLSDEWQIRHFVYRSVPVLCEVFNRPRSGRRLENILTSTDYLFESERYEALSRGLELPFKYAQLNYGEIAESFDDHEMNSSSVTLLTRFQLRGIGGFELPLKTYDSEYEVRALVRDNRLISAIDLYRREKKCSLQEAHAYVMSLKR